MNGTQPLVDSRRHIFELPYERVSLNLAESVRTGWTWILVSVSAGVPSDSPSAV